MKIDKWKLLLVFFASILFLFILVPLTVNALFQQYIPIKILNAEWDAGYALSYTAGAFSFIGTMFLGWVSWKQNQELQRKQNHTYMAENSAMVLMESIELFNQNQKAGNLELHPETIVSTEKNFGSIWEYGSFQCEISLKNLKNYPVAVRVIDADIVTGKKIYHFEKYDDCFTRTSLQDKITKFQLTLIASTEEKREIISEIQCVRPQISLDIMIEIVSDKYVSTTLKCRTLFSISNREFSYIGESDNPMCFWYGNSILSPSEINYRFSPKSSKNLFPEEVS